MSNQRYEVARIESGIDEAPYHCINFHNGRGKLGYFSEIKDATAQIKQHKIKHPSESNIPYVIIDYGVGASEKGKLIYVEYSDYKLEKKKI